jgi:NH3-dependent NAD+ synthetase
MPFGYDIKQKIEEAAEIVTADIQDGAVTAAKLAANAVETAKIKDSNVTAAKLATDSVETAKIKDANVTASKLATDAVETAKIKDANVTTAKIADDAADKTKIAANVAGTGLQQAAGGELEISSANQTILTNSNAICKSTHAAIPTGTPGTPAEGDLRYDTTAHKLRVYTGTAWETITSA